MILSTQLILIIVMIGCCLKLGLIYCFPKSMLYCVSIILKIESRFSMFYISERDEWLLNFEYIQFFFLNCTYTKDYIDALKQIFILIA